MRYMQEGESVLVLIPPVDRQGNPVAKYHEQEMTIERRVSFGKASSDVYYTLVGAKSDYGVEYGFRKEWLNPIE